MLDLRRLRLLRELAARGTLVAVARELNFTPSAVSQQLSVLERETGFSLLERSNGRIKLTAASEILVRHAEILLAQVEAAEADLAASQSEVAGTVRVASFQTGTLRLLVPAAALLAERHPNVRLETVEWEIGSSIPALRLQAIDLALGDEYDGVPMIRAEGLVRRDLLRQENLIVLPARHPLARLDRVPMALLAEEPWAAGSRSTGHRDVQMLMCRTFGGFEPRFRYRSDDLDVLIALVSELGAVTILPDVADHHDNDGIVLRSPAEGQTFRTVFSLIREQTGGASRPALDAVREAIDAVAERERTDARH